MSVGEIRMLRWISGNTRKDKIQTKENCLKIRVTPIDEKMRELFELVWSCSQDNKK
jgi:hypothetical protein